MKYINILVIAMSFVIGFILTNEDLNSANKSTQNEFITQTVDTSSGVCSSFEEEVFADFEVTLKEVNVYSEWSTTYFEENKIVDSIYVSDNIDYIKIPVSGVDVCDISEIKDIQIALNSI